MAERSISRKGAGRPSCSSARPPSATDCCGCSKSTEPAGVKLDRDPRLIMSGGGGSGFSLRDITKSYSSEPEPALQNSPQLPTDAARLSTATGAARPRKPPTTKKVDPRQSRIYRPLSRRSYQSGFGAAPIELSAVGDTRAVSSLRIANGDHAARQHHRSRPHRHPGRGRCAPQFPLGIGLAGQRAGSDHKRRPRR